MLAWACPARLPIVGAERGSAIVAETTMLDPQPTSWRTIIYGTPVSTSNDERVGTVREVLGSDGEDIFHGLRVHLADQRRDVMVSSDDVAGISSDVVRTSLSKQDFEALPAFDEEATYHLASVGWLRKHLGWERDSKGDEEPG